MSKYSERPPTASRPRSLFYKIDFVLAKMQRSALLCSLFTDVQRNDPCSLPPCSRYRFRYAGVPGRRRWFVYATRKFATLGSFYCPLVLRPTVRWWCTYFVSAVSRRRLIACLVCRALFYIKRALPRKSMLVIRDWFREKILERVSSYVGYQLNHIKLFALKRTYLAPTSTCNFNYNVFNETR